MSKIFCIGSNKTGTTSLDSALRSLGYNVCPEKIMFMMGSKYFENQKDGNYESIFELVGKYDAFEDRPWNHTDFYKHLDKKFPNSKFILTIRDVNNWIESYHRWETKINLRSQWFYNLVSNYCYGIDDFLSDENLMRQKYIERNNQIIEYFRNSNNLLILDLEKNDGWEKLCSFLNKSVPEKSFPHLNKTK